MTSVSVSAFKNERFRRRRHSYTSARAFAVPPQPTAPLSSTHPLLSFQRAGSLTSSCRSTSSESGDTGHKRRSFMSFLRSKKKRHQSASQQTSSQSENGRQHSSSDQDSLQECEVFEKKSESVRVVATVLSPQIYYKTLPITRYTTVFEVVVKLVGKYAKDEEQNPNNYYLTEVRESTQGSYSRLLQNSERVFDIQSRWEDGAKCCFTLCKREIVISDDEQLSDNYSQATVGMSPSQDCHDNAFTGVVDVDVPSTPTSPNTYNAKSSFFDGPLPPTQQTLPPTQTLIDPFLLSMSRPLQLSNKSVLADKRRSRSRVTSNSGGLLVANSNNNNPVDVSRLMQQSVSEGMMGIMTKVVNEGCQRVESAQLSEPHPSKTTPIKSMGGREMVLRPLICSPVDSVQSRKFPEFIFTPKPSNNSEKSEHSKPDVNKLDFEDTDQDEDTYKHSNVSHPSASLYKITCTLSAVKFATTCVIYPRYHSNASLYPLLSRTTLYSTAMNMTDTLHNMLESHLRPSSEGIISQQPMESTDSPQKQTKSTLKRHHTFHVRRDHLQLHINKEVPSLRDHMIQQAAQAIRQRHLLNIPSLSKGAGRLRGSTHSISSEVETDIDSLRDLCTTRSRHSSHSSSISEHLYPHSRTDSDGLFELRPRGMYRGMSSGCIHTAGVDTNQLKSYSHKTSTSSLASVTRTGSIQTIDHLVEVPDHMTDHVNATYNSEEAVNFAETSNDEVLYTFQSNYRPVTVLVSSRSAGTLGEHPSYNIELPSNKEQRISSEKWNFSSQRKPQMRTKSWVSEL